MSSTQTQELTPEGVLADIGYDGFVKSLFNRSGDRAKDFAHAILGIVTEINELHRSKDPVNFDEEAGDLGFYAQALLNLVEEFMAVEFTDDYVSGLSLERVDEMYELLVQTPGYGRWDLVEDSCTELLDLAKRWVGYGREPDFIKAVSETGGLLLFVTAGSDQSDYLRYERLNVAKLLERYKGVTFSADRAVNRDTAAEREVLEQHAGA